MPIILGIDPGLSGGIAFLSAAAGQPRRVISADDIPVFGEGPKRRVDALALAKMIQACPPDFAVIERAQAMPDQGSSSGFNYGRAVGALEAVVLGMEIPLEIVEATAWKKTHGLIKTDKEASRQKALLLFPDAHALLARKKDHGRAESILIANYGAMLRR
jgi:crossover junction endodeoxyribonuclease RuvC